MGNFSETVKGFVNKHFTQEVTCSHCDKTGKVMFYSPLQDGNIICSSCKRSIPEQFKFKPKESTLEHFKELYNFMEYTHKELEPIFNPTPSYSYGDFKVDAEHNLCKVNGSFVFEISNISAFQFHYKVDNVNKGTFSTYVEGDVYLTSLFLKHPYAAFDETSIKLFVKTPATIPLFSNKPVYDNPVEMDYFVARFTSLWESVQEEKETQELLEQSEGTKNE